MWKIKELFLQICIWYNNIGSTPLAFFSNRIILELKSGPLYDLFKIVYAELEGLKMSTQRSRRMSLMRQGNCFPKEHPRLSGNNTASSTPSHAVTASAEHWTTPLICSSSSTSFLISRTMLNSEGSMDEEDDLTSSSLRRLLPISASSQLNGPRLTYLPRCQRWGAI